MNLRSSLLVVSTSTLLISCTMAPKYQRPAAPVPNAWSSSSNGAAATPVPAPDLGWKTFFKDPQLQSLISISLQENRDLRVAALTVERVAAQYRIQRAELFPTLAADGSYTRSRSPSTLVIPGQPNPSSIYNVNLGVSAWELDFFGRIRSLKDEALETYFAQEQNRRSVQLSLIAQVATQYFTQRALGEQVTIAQNTLRSQSDALNLTKRSYEVGSASELDFRTAARSDLAALQRQYAQSLTALALLVGRPLPEAVNPPAQSLDDGGTMTELPAGLPSDLLDRRPDILEAEHQLKAFNANIGAARAAFFPRISLTASGGTESLRLSGLFKAGSEAWSFTPELALPLFAGGANLANLEVAKVEKLAAAAQYEKTIQTAFKEVSDALTARTLYSEEIEARQAVVTADQLRYNIAEARYRHGVDSYLTALDAQRNLYGAQQTLVQTRLARLTNLVSLYRALGGGWNEQTVTNARSEK
jgi:multidrug efflux system outer membrane protein